MQDFQWLKQAQSLQVGQSKRIYHGSERRPNLIVRNLPDKYTAYCFRCKEYAEKRKDYVKILQEQQPKGSDDCSRRFINLFSPTAMYLTPLHDVAYFLHSKHMCLEWLKPYNPRWDPKRFRLVLNFQGRTIGRDIYGYSSIKWFNYGSYVYEDRIDNARTIILTEDVLSAAKGIIATGLPFYALFGTSLTRALESSIIASNPSHIGVMLDGDQAGFQGASRVRQRLSLLGISCKILNPQKGDPKEQRLEWYREQICKI